MNIENNNKDFLPNIFLFQPELEQKNNFLQLLKESEFTVLYITNLEALYKNLLSGSCQILLIDIDQLGEQAVSIIKYLVSIKLDISIITLTSFDNNSLNRKVIAAGADFYLVTPFRDKLLEIFKSVVVSCLSIFGAAIAILVAITKMSIPKKFLMGFE